MTFLVLALVGLSLPNYISALNNSRQAAANENARAIAIAVRTKSTISGGLDTSVCDYSLELGGNLPVNPCGGSPLGYSIVPNGVNGAQISANPGSNCGAWTPAIYFVNY